MHRVLFEKTGTAIWMSHLDLMRLMQRAFRRAGVLLHHSQGYTPHAYVSMLLPLSVGMESHCEIMEYEIYEEKNGALEKKAKGELSCPEVPAGDKGNRFSALNAMSLYLGIKDDEKLKDSMIKYAADDRIVEKLFPLME